MRNGTPFYVRTPEESRNIKHGTTPCNRPSGRYTLGKLPQEKWGGAWSFSLKHGERCGKAVGLLLSESTGNQPRRFRSRRVKRTIELDETDSYTNRLMAGTAGESGIFVIVVKNAGSGGKE